METEETNETAFCEPEIPRVGALPSSAGGRCAALRFFMARNPGSEGRSVIERTLRYKFCADGARIRRVTNNIKI